MDLVKILVWIMLGDTLLVEFFVLRFKEVF